LTNNRTITKTETTAKNTIDSKSQTAHSTVLDPYREVYINIGSQRLMSMSNILLPIALPIAILPFPFFATV
jgi:hypothetical protein